MQKEGGIESTYKEIGIRGFYKLYNQEKIEERFKYDFGNKKYDNIMDRLESRRVYNKDLSEAKEFYGKGLKKELEVGDRIRFLSEKQIGDKNYAIFKAGEGEYRMMESNRCIGIRQYEEVNIYKARDGGLAGAPSQEALWERKVSGLSDAFGKEVSFGAEIGDRGKYGGEIEFEGKRYGVMHQYDEVKLIDKRDFAENFNVKEGGYMKIKQYREDKNEIIAVRDTAKYKEIEMDRVKDRGFEIEM